MPKYRCLGCGKVTDAKETPKECSKCGDSEQPVFEVK